MKKIDFTRDVFPHAVAVVIFLVLTILFFRPLFFNNMALNQSDITQFLWSSKELRDFRDATDQEGLWAGAMFSGMPAYMINLDWSDEAVSLIKRIFSFYLPHPVNGIFWALLSYYVMLLAFRVRPYLAIAGAIAFAFTSYMIIGLSAGHNSRIGAIAFMPLIVAGIHLVFSQRKTLGFAVTTLGMALHLRENHLQITYYLMLIVMGYGLMQLVFAVREKKWKEFSLNIAVLVGAVLIAIGSFFGQMWAVMELAKYSTRGKSELTVVSADASGSGLPKSYAFEFSYGILEPMTMLIPNFYGGSSGDLFVSNDKSASYQALMNSGDREMINQLAQFTSAYWGPQRLSSPYYASAIIVFLFILGAMVVERKYVAWLVPVAILGILFSWGSSFQSFNYFMFDHLPGYNKFRSVTFAMIMAFFAMPLLAMLGLEKILQEGVNPAMKKKLWIAFGATGGLCALFVIAPGILSFTRDFEDRLPTWFLHALQSDRKDLLRADAFRSLAFIGGIFILLFFNVPKKISPNGFFAFLGFMVAVDLMVVDSRYFTKENNYVPATTARNYTPSAADEQILKDKTYYRVFNLQGFYEAGTSYFHNSLGGYSAVRLKRYQELYDSCIIPESERLLSDAQAGPLNMDNYGVLNMLNAKYFVYGESANNVFLNTSANGNGWFPREIVTVNSPNEELRKIADVNTRLVAVVDQSKMKLQSTATDSTGVIHFLEKKPYWQKYESQSAKDGLAVFSEIYYPEGWTATIDGKEVPILRANYVLRALEVPAGSHTIEFLFQPKSYVIGNKVTMVSSFLVVLIVVGALVFELRKRPNE